ncbi:MAG TPA: hypothetical protein VEV83_20450 [Parafilimonas sp.]|nr:hypothetical protein [Parafilimonas sp.]
MNSVNVRIANSMGFSVDSAFLVYDESGFNYRAIAAGDTTGYHLYESLIDDPAVYFFKNGDQFLAGPILAPPLSAPTHLANGKYIVRIFVDSSFLTGYNVEFIKE